MIHRSFYDSLCLNAEGASGAALPAPADQTAGHPVETAAADAGLDTSSEPQDEPSLDEQLDAIWDEAHGEPARDANGRFKSRTKDTAEGSDADGGEELSGEELAGDDVTDHPDEKSVSDTTSATDDMPNSWSKDMAEEWKSLTPAMRSYIAKRETETQQALSRAGRAVNIVKNAEPVLNAVAPFTKYLNQVSQHMGKPPEQLISDVLRFENTLRTAPDNETKLTVLKDIIAEYGVDVSSLIGADADVALRGRPDIDITRHPDFVEMRRKLHQIETMTIGERQQQLQAQAEEMDAAIHTAATDTANFPHFEKVRAVMAGLIQAMPDDPSVPVKDLIKRAYDAACRADPDIFERIQKDQQEKVRLEQQRQQRERAARAQRAAAPNVKTTTPSPSKRTMDQDMEAIASKYYK